MADNIDVTPGSGKKIGADECTVNSVQVLLQEIKIALGAKGVFQRFLEAGALTKANSISMCLATDESKANILDTASSHKAVETLQADDYVYVNGTIAQVQRAVISASNINDNQIVAADATKKIGVLGYALTVSAAVNAKWRNGTTDITGLLYLQAGIVVPFQRFVLFETSTNAALNLHLSTATAVGGHVLYVKY